MYYYDEVWREIEKADSAEFYRLITYDKGISYGKFTDYYTSGQPQMEGTLFTEKPEQYEGELIYYSKEGYIQNIQFYEKGVINYDKSISL